MMQKPTHAGEALCVEATIRAPSGKRTKLGVIQFEETKFAESPYIQINHENSVCEWVDDNRAMRMLKIIPHEAEGQAEEFECHG